MSLFKWVVRTLLIGFVVSFIMALAVVGIHCMAIHGMDQELPSITPGKTKPTITT